MGTTLYFHSKINRSIGSFYFWRLTKTTNPKAEFASSREIWTRRGSCTRSSSQRRLLQAPGSCKAELESVQGAFDVLIWVHNVSGERSVRLEIFTISICGFNRLRKGSITTPCEEIFLSSIIHFFFFLFGIFLYSACLSARGFLPVRENIKRLCLQGGYAADSNVLGSLRPRDTRRVRVEKNTELLNKSTCFCPNKNVLLGKEKEK